MKLQLKTLAICVGLMFSATTHAVDAVPAQQAQGQQPQQPQQPQQQAQGQQPQQQQQQQPQQQGDYVGQAPPNTIDLGSVQSFGTSFPPPLNYNKSKEEVVAEALGMALTPQQVKNLKDLFLRQEREKASPYSYTARPIVRSIPVDLSPAAQPPVVRMSYGMQTSIVFSDLSGNPWEIERVSFNHNLFSDDAPAPQQSSDQGGQPNNQQPQTIQGTNILSIEPLTATSYGNVTVTLKGLHTPVIFILSTGQNEVDMRVDARLSGRSPTPVNSALRSNLNGISSGVMANIDSQTLMFLDGTPPLDAERVRTSDPSVEAWLYNGQYIVRSRDTVLYPSYKTTARSTSGTGIFIYPDPINQVTISRNGQPATIYLNN